MLIQELKNLQFLQKSKLAEVLMMTNTKYNSQIDINQPMSQDYAKIDIIDYCDLESYSYSNYMENGASHSHLQFEQEPQKELEIDDPPRQSQTLNYDLKQWPDCIQDENQYFYDFEPSNQSTYQMKSSSDYPSLKQENIPQKTKTIKKKKSSTKNQYDKNIVGNVTSMIIKNILSRQYQEEIKQYCILYSIIYSGFYSFFADIERQKVRWGTSQVSNFFTSNEISEGLKKVFSLFMIRYLKYDYIRYVMIEGKMKEKTKYLGCATKLMYIPSLRKEEYIIITCLMKKA